MSLFDTLSTIHSNMNFSIHDVLTLDFGKPESWLIIGMFACLTMGGIELGKILEMIIPWVERVINKFFSRH